MTLNLRNNSHKSALKLEMQKRTRDFLIRIIKTNLNKQLQETKITPEGATYVKALLKESEDWLRDNPDVSADEIDDESAETADKLAQNLRG
jgi:transposase